MKKLSWSSVLAFVLLASSACSTVPIRDITLYWPMGADGAAVTHTLKDDEAVLTKEDWEALSRQSVCMSYDAFAMDVRAVIEKLCSEHKALCKKEIEEKVQGFSMRTRRAALKNSRKEL